MNVYLPFTVRLPSEYQEVEYIVCDGSQYINTSIKPDYNTKIASKFMHNESTHDTPLFGVRDTYNSRQYILWTHPYEYSSGCYAQFSNNNTSEDPGKHDLNSYPKGTIIEFEVDKNGGKYGGQTWTWSITNNPTNYNLCLLGLNHQGSIDSRKFYGRVYYFKIWSSDTLILNLVPCYRKSDSVIGMYDLVNNQFYTNAGTGTFSKGSDVTMAELKNAYIGEYPSILEYDFTQSDGGWTKTSNVSRNSNGYYISGGDIDGYITPPNEVYSKTPKKIQIIFNRPDNYCGTGIYSGGSYWYFLPRMANSTRLDWNYNGTITQNNISFGTGDKTWELDIDSSTTNWTIIHKITGNSNITDIGGVLKYLWTNNAFGIRTVHWSPSGTGPYIKKVIIEY